MCLVATACTAARSGADRQNQTDAAIPERAGWTQLMSGTDQSLHAVQFFDAAEGLIAGESVTLRRTVDGGRNWSAVGVPLQLEAAAGFTGLQFSSSDDGWLVGPNTLLHTLNGGLEWKLWRDWGSSQGAAFNSVVALSDSTAWTAGAIDDPSDPTQCVAPKGSARGCPALWRIRFAAPKTIDSAEHLIRSDYDAFMDVSFATADIGFAVGTRGLIFRIDNAQAQGAVDLKLQDAGIVPYPEAPAFTGVFALDDNNAWVVGQAGLIYRTRDGQTWSAQQSGVKFDLHDVVFLDSDHGWIVGDHGTVLRSSDGGAHWERESMVVDETLYALSFPSPDLGYAVGDHGTVIKWSVGKSP
jgi:photosystem II stability/assembly factor-like uncharacterized protein